MRDGTKSMVGVVLLFQPASEIFPGMNYPLALFPVVHVSSTHPGPGRSKQCANKVCDRGFSRPRHLQGKRCKTGLCGQAWSFPLFDPT